MRGLRTFAIAMTVAAAATAAANAASRKPTRKPTRASSATSATTFVADADPRRAQAAQSAERDRLTARIAALKAQIAAGERSKSGASAALKQAERSLADVNRRLDELARRRREGEERVAGIDRQRAGTESRLAQRRAAYARAIVLLDENGARDARRDWLDGGDPRDALLTGIALERVAGAEAAQVAALGGRVRDLEGDRRRADDENRALLAQADAQRTTRDALAADQAARQRAFADLSRQLAEQRSTAAALAADEERLTRVIDQLQRVLDRQAAAERAKREAARREAAQRDAKREASARDAGKAGGSSSVSASNEPARRDAAPAAPAERVDDVAEAGGPPGAFAGLRGQLRLPVRGALVARFGAPRGSGGATWKGIFVRADAGAEIHAVAPGKVVFADALRGFGNLVIVDHGDQYLSIYGNNETLTKRAGDVVRTGDVVARAGNSIGDEETGLYFELRHQGRPFDPLTWTAGR